MKIIKLLGLTIFVVMLAVGILIGAVWIEHFQTTTMPSPTGEYPVGRRFYVWSDPSQAELLAPQPGTPRTLLVWIWYPAAPLGEAESNAMYLPKAWRNARAEASGALMTDVLTRDLARVRTHSIADALLSPEQRTYPVVIMRAGLAALTTDYTTLAEDLASHGYVVIGFDAPYRSRIVVLPNGRVIARAPQNDADRVSGSVQELLGEKLVNAWSEDASFALDQLQRLDAGDPSWPFAGHLDLSRVGIFGHSLGGATALQFCSIDPRCKAGIDIDGAPLGNVIDHGPKQPCMLLLSDHRRETDKSTLRVKANMRLVYRHLSKDTRLAVWIEGANHFDFSDNAVLKSHIMMAILQIFGVVRISGQRQLSVTARCVSGFFDVYLKGAPRATLRNCTGQPVVKPFASE